MTALVVATPARKPFIRCILQCKPTWQPFPQYTLYPLYSLGLCDAVTITPAAAPSSCTAAATNGVGTTCKMWRHDRVISRPHALEG